MDGRGVGPATGPTIFNSTNCFSFPCTRSRSWNWVRHNGEYLWKIMVGAVAQWLERATDNREVAGSNPAEDVWKLWQFPLPHFASVFRKRK